MKEDKFRSFVVIRTIILCLVCISCGQVIQQFVQQLVNDVTKINMIGYIISAIVYIGFAYVFLKFICIKILHISMEQCRIGKIQIRLKWFIAALFLPIFVSGIMLCIPGELIVNNLERNQLINILGMQVFVYALGGGIVEEMIFRGVMMSSIENKYGKLWAIIIPSTIFALGHLANDNMIPGIMIMKMIAGVSVGCMFSLVIYESESIWNSIVIHVLWNASVTGGFINIGLEHDTNSLFSYVIDKEYSFITGGAVNIEASFIAIAGYLIVSSIAIYYLKTRKQHESVVCLNG